MPIHLAPYIEHTNLKPTATAADIRQLCQEAKEYGMHAVCVPPSRVALAASCLAGSRVVVVTVIGFPLGYNTSLTKANEAREAVINGARELDIVINLSLVKEHLWTEVEKEIFTIGESVRRILPEATLKVILETGYLTIEEMEAAAACAVRSGVHFVKTSTGFGPRGVTVEDIIFLRQVLPPEIGIKAAGGIRTASQARELIKAGASRLGTSAGIAILRE